MTAPPFLAVDLGAGSGRACLGSFAEGRLAVAEVHRFENRPVRLGGTVYWDFLHLWDNVLRGLAACSARGVRGPAAIGIDSWNLDFGLVDEEGRLLANPVSYRDQSAGWVAEEIARRLDPVELYRLTGLPVFPLTGLARLIQMGRDSRRGLLELARLCLPIPDLVRFFLAGQAAEEAGIEQTISWGTQLVDIHSRSWSQTLVREFAIPGRLLPGLVPTGTVGASLSGGITALTGLQACPVVAVAEHDTASAFLAAGLIDREAALLSAGTWSILGAVLERPLATAEAHRLGFMNEIAYRSTVLAKNLMGFYVLEEFLELWRARGVVSGYEEMMGLARAAPSGGLALDPNDPLFFSPPNVEAAFGEYCRKSGQRPVAEPGAIARAVYEGLAASYARALTELNGLLGRELTKIVMVGGGVRNPLFCGLVAAACGVEVLTGPAEATVVGNLCVQALALGQLRLEELGAVLAASFSIESYHPGACRLRAGAGPAEP